MHVLLFSFLSFTVVTVTAGSTSYSLFESSKINEIEKMHKEWLEIGGFRHFNDTMNVCGGVKNEPWYTTAGKCMHQNLNLLCPVKDGSNAKNNVNSLFPVTDICDGHIEQLGNYRGCKVSQMVDQAKGKDGCVVISVGSHGDFQFEEAVYNKTSCLIHTFDGSYYEHMRPEYIRDRTFYHKYHFGTKKGKAMHGRLNVIDFPGALALANVTADRPLLIMKVDCEGCEKTLFSHIIQNRNMEHALPHQIYTELHWHQTQPTVSQNIELMTTAKDLLINSNFAIFEDVRGYRAKACEVAFVRLEDKKKMN